MDSGAASSEAYPCHLDLQRAWRVRKGARAMAPEDLPPSCRLRRPRGSPDQRAIAVAEMQVAEKCTKQKKGRYDAELGVRPDPKPQALRGLKQIAKQHPLPGSLDCCASAHSAYVQVTVRRLAALGIPTRTPNPSTLHPNPCPQPQKPEPQTRQPASINEIPVISLYSGNLEA